MTAISCGYFLSGTIIYITKQLIWLFSFEGSASLAGVSLFAEVVASLPALRRLRSFCSLSTTLLIPVSGK